ncbi:MAG TPA: LPD38 domain-containing protein [Noviherbaspirillum sp.]|nr:LPD38 domain-containing protein [Noviherbaspirillum sp.]
MTCTYTFAGPDGESLTITGKNAFKAYLANGGLVHLMPERAAIFGNKLQSVRAASSPVVSGLNRDGVRQAITGGVLGPVISRMIDSGAIVLHDTVDTLPAGVSRVAGMQAVTTKGQKIHLIGDALTAGNARAVLLHEAFHRGAEKLIGTDQWNAMMSRLDALRRQSQQSSGRARDFFDVARARVESAEKQGAVGRDMSNEEFAAYAIEEYESAPATLKKWVDDLIGMVKAWVQMKFGKQLGEITPAQLSALAKMAIMDTAADQRGELFGRVGELFSVGTKPAPATSTAAAPAKAGLTPPEQGKFRTLQAALQDNMNRVREVQDRIAELTGRPVSEAADYYGAETNRPGRIAARLEDAKEQLTGPLMQKLAKSGKTPEQLSELLHAMHAKERNAAVAKINPEHGDPENSPGSGMADSKADAILAKYANDRELHKLADEARAITKATLDLKLAYGLINQDTYSTLADMYEFYVPLKGDGEFGPKIKRAMGHEEREEHILENIARDYDQAVVVGEKNLARQSLLRLVLQNPDKELWTVGVPPRGRYVAAQVYRIMHGKQEVASFTSQAQVSAFLEAKGPQAAAYNVWDSQGQEVKEFAKPLQDNEVMVYVKGDPVRIQIHDEKLARQLRPLDQAQMGPILEFMRASNRYLSKIYTGYNPAFIPRNMARDAMTGTINMIGNEGAGTAAKAWTKYPAAVKALTAWAATGKIPSGEMGKLLKEYREHGGKVGASWMPDLEAQGKSLQFMFDNARGFAATAKEGDLKRTAAVGWHKTVGKLAHVVEVANQATENGLRLALYATMREQGASPGVAARAAKSVTVDFDRKGTATGALGAIYLFFNPAVQGAANAIKTLAKGEHKQQAFAALGALAMLGLWAASKGMGDDKDRWLGEGWETRSKNFMLSVGDHHIQVPLSQEFSPVYALGVALAEAMHGESPMKSSLHVVSSFIDAYFPLQGAFNAESDNHLADFALATTPTLIKPGVQNAMNRNSFGSQIVPESEATKDRPDNLKMYRATKGTAYDKAAQGIASIGEMFGSGKYENDLSKVSPETLKYLWRQYTGGLGGFVTDSLGLAGMTTMDGMAPESSDVPFVKDFWRQNDVKAIRGRYYDLTKEARAAIAEYEVAKKAGDGDAIAKMDDAKMNLVALGKMVRSTNKAVAALRDEEVNVNADPNLTPAQKREQLKALEKDEESLYRAGIDAFK